MFFVIILIFFIAYQCNYSEESASNRVEKSTSQRVYEQPPKFVLTEMNGRELEDLAYFTIKYDNTFELRLMDGTVFTYTPMEMQEFMNA